MKLLLFIYSVCICLPAIAQQAHRKAAPPVKKAAERKALKFPFSTTKNILLLSFTSPYPVDTGIINPDGSPVLQPAREKRGLLGDTLGHIDVHEIVKLDNKMIKKLNYCFRNTRCSGPPTSHTCYDPRNAILFMDENNKIIAELELCFACEDYVMRPTDFDAGDMRACKYAALKKIFQSAGITYGVSSR